MAQMASAVRAHDFRPDHPEGHVGLLVDRVLARRGVERRPAAARVVLRVGYEELGSAADAVVRAGLEDVVVLTCERTLRALLAEHVVLLGRELGAPFLICFLDLRHHLIQRTATRKVPGQKGTVPYEGLSPSEGRNEGLSLGLRCRLTGGRDCVKVRSSSPAGLRVGGTWHM